MITIIRAFIAFLMGVGFLTPNQEVEILDNLGFLDKHHGIVISQLYEGYAESDDLYCVSVSGFLYEVSADDLNAGDLVTVWFYGNIPVRVMYDWR